MFLNMSSISMQVIITLTRSPRTVINPFMKRLTQIFHLFINLLTKIGNPHRDVIPKISFSSLKPLNQPRNNASQIRSILIPTAAFDILVVPYQPFQPTFDFSAEFDSVEIAVLV